MKKNLLLVLFAFIFAAPVFAQAQNAGISPELQKKCTRLTQDMAQELRLTEMAYIKLKALNFERMGQTEELLATYGNNEHLFSEKMKEVETAYEKGIATILTQKQMEAYAEYNKASFETVFLASSDKK